VKRRPDKPENPDIEFTADVKARELRFEEVPETEVRFPGHPERESTSGTDREGMPDEVEPGVTHRQLARQPGPRTPQRSNRRTGLSDPKTVT